VAEDLLELDLLLAEILRCGKSAGGGGLGALLQQARQLHSTALLKDLVLQSQMDVLRRAVVHQSQSVAGLIQQTVQAVRRLVGQGGGSRRASAAGAAGQLPGPLREQQDVYQEAAAAVAEVLAARDALQQAPGESSLRALVACLVGAGGRLQQVPELLLGAADTAAAAADAAADGQRQEGAGPCSGSERLIEVVEAVQQVRWCSAVLACASL
jgi:hypothetical protein